jgi:hypothetical protein
MNKTSKILEWIDILKRRPLMILSDTTFLSLRGYVEGYVDALGLAYDIPKLALYISLWFQKKVGKQSDVLWINQIVYNNEKSDEELKVIVLETLTSFFEENPDWFNLGQWINTQ